MFTTQLNHLANLVKSLGVHLRTKWLSSVAVILTSDIASLSIKEFLDIQVSKICGFTLKRVRDMTRSHSQMHRFDKYSQHSSIIWPVWLNSCVIFDALLTNLVKAFD